MEEEQVNPNSMQIAVQWSDLPKLFNRGSLCPGCEQGILDYNGLLDLECPLCGYTLPGGAGCT